MQLEIKDKASLSMKHLGPRSMKTNEFSFQKPLVKSMKIT